MYNYNNYELQLVPIQWTIIILLQDSLFTGTYQMLLITCSSYCPSPVSLIAN